MEKNENGYSEYNVRRGNTSGGCQGNTPPLERENRNADSRDLSGQRQLAMVYSPYQCWRMIYTPADALMHGTLFEELYKPLGECKNGK